MDGDLIGESLEIANDRRRPYIGVFYEIVIVDRLDLEVRGQIRDHPIDATIIVPCLEPDLSVV